MISSYPVMPKLMFTTSGAVMRPSRMSSRDSMIIPVTSKYPAPQSMAAMMISASWATPTPSPARFPTTRVPCP